MSCLSRATAFGLFGFWRSICWTLRKAPAPPRQFVPPVGAELGFERLSLTRRLDRLLAVDRARFDATLKLGTDLYAATVAATLTRGRSATNATPRLHRSLVLTARAGKHPAGAVLSLRPSFAPDLHDGVLAGVAPAPSPCGYSIA